MLFEAWFFDVYPVPGGMATWWIGEDGARLRLLDPWRPALYVDAAAPELPLVRPRGGGRGRAPLRREPRLAVDAGPSPPDAPGAGARACGRHPVPLAGDAARSDRARRRRGGTAGRRAPPPASRTGPARARRRGPRSAP